MSTFPTVSGTQLIKALRRLSLSAASADYEMGSRRILTRRSSPSKCSRHRSPVCSLEGAPGAAQRTAWAISSGSRSGKASRELSKTQAAVKNGAYYLVGSPDTNAGTSFTIYRQLWSIGVH